jgi:hypothetical protein
VIKKHVIAPIDKNRRIRYWCEDESRVGLKTEAGRLITIKGKKPIGIMQWKRENFYLYGLVEPLTGEYFIWEFSHLNAACFQRFLEKFSATYPQDIHIIQLDNGAFHFSKHLQIPENIICKDSGSRVLTKGTLEGEYHRYEPQSASRFRPRKFEPVIQRRTGGHHH